MVGWKSTPGSFTARRGGFTLIELLVVIAIIGLLASLLAPAVGAALETTRRCHCSNNLKQLSLAVQQYEGANSRLPPSGLMGNTLGIVDPRSGIMLSWCVTILPYVDQWALYKQWNLSRTAIDQPNEPQANVLDIMLCPSDSARGRFFVDSALTGGKRFAKANCAAFCSPFHTELQLQYPGALISTAQPIAKILDGTSNTLLLSEVRTVANQQDQRGAWALPWTGASLLAFDMHHAYWLSQTTYVASPSSLGLTQRPNTRGPNVDMLYACPDAATVQLEGMPCGVWASSGPENYLSAAPRSWHPGGVNVTFVDGHTGFLHDNIDEVTMAYLISINDQHDTGAANVVH